MRSTTETRSPRGKNAPSVTSQMEFFTPELALCKLSDTVFTVQCPGNFSQFESAVINKEAIYMIAGEPFKEYSNRDKWLDDLV